jgi:hypothetical protein
MLMVFFHMLTSYFDGLNWVSWCYPVVSTRLHPGSSPSCGFLHLNLVPFALRGWCRVESEWSTMRGASGTRRIDEGSERSVEMEEDGGDSAIDAIAGRLV